MNKNLQKIKGWMGRGGARVGCGDGDSGRACLKENPQHFTAVFVVLWLVAAADCNLHKAERDQLSLDQKEQGEN